jgi:hypothetical protein
MLLLQARRLRSEKDPYCYRSKYLFLKIYFIGESFMFFEINKYLLFCVMFVIVCFNSAVYSQNFDNVKISEKKEELKKKWQEYLHSLGTVEGTMQYLRKRNGNVEGDFLMECVSMYPLWLDQRSCGTILKREEDDSYDSVGVTGKDYQFSLRRAYGTKNWTINELKFGKSDKKLHTWKFPVYLANPPSFQEDPAGYNIFSTLGVGLLGITSSANLPYLILSEWCTIKEMKEVDQDGMKQLQLSFEFIMPDFPEEVKKTPEFEKQSSSWKRYTVIGKVTLITNYFLISEAKFHWEYMSGAKDADVKITYDTETYRTPLPKRYYVFTEHNNYSSGTRIQNTSELLEEFDLRETKPKNVKRFTLSAYGLPEPDFDNSRRTNRVRYILMGLGAILILIALWRIIQKRRGRM